MSSPPNHHHYRGKKNKNTTAAANGKVAPILPSLSSKPIHASSPTSPGFIPPGASSIDKHVKNAFQRCFESHFYVPKRIAKAPSSLVEAVNDFHYAMMNDLPRNEFYYKALKQHITPDSGVLEIGAGSGLLSMMAAKLNAKWVVAVEGSEEMARLATANIKKNKMEDKIKVLNILSTDLKLNDLPDKPDILVSEIFGTLMLGESALDYIQDVRTRLLKPTSKIIPQFGIQYAVPIECPVLDTICNVSSWQDIDLSTVTSLKDTASCVFTKKYGFRMSSIPYTKLADPIPALTVDFAKDKAGFARTKQSFRFNAKKTGTAHAMLLYWEITEPIIKEKKDEKSTAKTKDEENTTTTTDVIIDHKEEVLLMSTDPEKTIDNFPRDMQWGQALQLLDAASDPQAAFPEPLLLEEAKEYHVTCLTSQDNVVMQFNVRSAELKSEERLLHEGRSKKERNNNKNGKIDTTQESKEEVGKEKKPVAEDKKSDMSLTHNNNNNEKKKKNYEQTNDRRRQNKKAKKTDKNDKNKENEGQSEDKTEETHVNGVAEKICNEDK